MAIIDIRKPKNTDFIHYLRDNLKMVLTITDQDKAAVDLSSDVLIFSIRESENGAAIDTLTTADGDIVVSGASSNVLTFNKAVSGLSERDYYVDLWSETRSETLIDGIMECTYQGR